MNCLNFELKIDLKFEANGAGEFTDRNGRAIAQSRRGTCASKKEKSHWLIVQVRDGKFCPRKPYLQFGNRLRFARPDGSSVISPVRNQPRAPETQRNRISKEPLIRLVYCESSLSANRTHTKSFLSNADSLQRPHTIVANVNIRGLFSDLFLDE